jgi:hypothetical protein
MNLFVASAETEDLVEELLKRNVLIKGRAEMFVDGAVRRQSNMTDAQFNAYVELQLLDLLKKGMATAQPSDRAYSLTVTPASGDYAPGSMVHTVELVAVRVT